MEVKREILRMLREDEEFRYAVAGLIGLEEILKRMDRHGEEIRGLREETRRIWKEIERLRGDMLRGFERHDKIMEEMRKEIEDLRRDMMEGFRRMDRRLDALGTRWGLQTEEAFREGLKGLLEEELGLRVERWVKEDEEGSVYGYPSIVEIDIATSDDKVILIEVSSHVRPSDVILFHRKAEFYERVTGVKPSRLLMVTPYAEREAHRTAERYGVEIYTGI